MGNSRYDVLGIGNAIVDILGQCDDALLKSQALTKGTMHLIDAEAADRLYAVMGPAVEISGGSAANTLAGVGSFGGRAAFIGKVAGDDFGRTFAHDIRATGVAFETSASDGSAPTSRCLIFVTPDGERTMNTFLGVSTELGPSDVDPDLIGASEILYLEGYLFDRPQAKAAFEQAVRHAKAAGRRVALSLSDPFCVDRHRAAFLDLIRTGVDIVFANEHELKSLYQTEDFDAAAEQAASLIPLAVLTRSEKGSLIRAGSQAISVAAAPVAQVVDATGAGDLYAAGFLFGLSTNRDLAECGRLGSLAAAEVISHVGARPQRKLSDFVNP